MKLNEGKQHKKISKEIRRGRKWEQGNKGKSRKSWKGKETGKERIN